MTIYKNRIFFGAMFCVLIFFALFSIYFLKPEIEGDTPSYLEAISVLSGGELPQNFIPNRILTTFGAIESIIILSKILGSVFGAWLFLNLFFYFALSFTFYLLILKIFKSHETSFITTLFFASNYSLLNFGLTYLMDIGGWTFYILSIFFTYQYLESKDYKNLIWAGIAIGVGGLFKEYAFLACIPIAVTLIYEYWHSPFGLIKKAIVQAMFALLPTILVYAYVFEVFDYSYIDWLSFNKGYYIYHSRIIEYIKSLGSLYNFMAPLVLLGLYTIIQARKEMFANKKIPLFVFGVLLSVLPIFFWPAITQRILFITVPAMLLIAAFFLKKFEKYWWIFLPVLILYTVSSFMMDSFILPNLNLPF